jgi:hypothetical protein
MISAIGGRMTVRFLPGNSGLANIVDLSRDSADRWEYEARIAKRFGFEQQLELCIPMS